MMADTKQLEWTLEGRARFPTVNDESVFEGEAGGEGVRSHYFTENIQLTATRRHRPLCYLLCVSVIAWVIKDDNIQ